MEEKSEITLVKYRYKKGKVVIGRVIGYNYDIGVTIINNNNSDEYLLCMSGPSSPNGKQIKFMLKRNIKRYLN